MVENTDLEDDGENYVVRSFDDDFFKKFNDLINTLQRQHERELVERISANQKGQFEDDAGHICWYLDDLIAMLTTNQEGEN